MAKEFVVKHGLISNGDILPNASGTSDIGSASLPFKDLHLTGDSVYMGGYKVLYMDGANVIIDSPGGDVVMSGGVDLATHNASGDHDGRYYTETELDAGQLDNRYHTESEITTISGDLQNNIDTNETAIGLNTTHRGSDGSDHSIVGDNTTAIGLNTTHRGSDGSDHSIVGSNTSAIGLNTTHRGSDGSDHSIVGDNQTHATGNGTDHSGLALVTGGRNITGQQTFESNVVVRGDLVVSGTRFITETEIVQIEDNLMVINYGEVGAGVSEGFAGIEVDRGASTNYQFMFDEANDNFKVGISGALQPVATREESASMTDTGIPYWSGSNIRFETVAGFIYTGGNVRVPSASPSNVADLTRKDYVDGKTTTHESTYNHTDIASNTSARHAASHT